MDIQLRPQDQHLRGFLNLRSLCNNAMLRPLILALYGLVFSYAWAQQLSDSPVAFGWTSLLSSGCQTAINATVDCPSFLSSIYQG
jgi:hypothetical protein